MAAPTFPELRDRLRNRILLDAEKTYWSDDELTDNLNRAQRQFVKDTKCLRQEGFLTTYENQEVYTLPEDCEELLSVERGDGTKLTPTTSAWLEQQHGVGWRTQVASGDKAIYYYSDLDGAGKIRLWPRPDPAEVTEPVANPFTANHAASWATSASLDVFEAAVVGDSIIIISASGLYRYDTKTGLLSTIDASAGYIHTSTQLHHNIASDQNYAYVRETTSDGVYKVSALGTATDLSFTADSILTAWNGYLFYTSGSKTYRRDVAAASSTEIKCYKYNPGPPPLFSASSFNCDAACVTDDGSSVYFVEGNEIHTLSPLGPSPASGSVYDFISYPASTGWTMSDILCCGDKIYYLSRTDSGTVLCKFDSFPTTGSQDEVIETYANGTVGRMAFVSATQIAIFCHSGSYTYLDVLDTEDDTISQYFGTIYKSSWSLDYRRAMVVGDSVYVITQTTSESLSPQLYLVSNDLGSVVYSDGNRFSSELGVLVDYSDTDIRHIRFDGDEGEVVAIYEDDTPIVLNYVRIPVEDAVEVPCWEAMLYYAAHLCYEEKDHDAQNVGKGERWLARYREKVSDERRSLARAYVDAREPVKSYYF